MKILFVINKFAGGGRERRLVQLVRGLEKIGGFELHATVFFDKIEYPEVRKTGLIIHHLNLKNRRVLIQQYKSLVEDIRPDIIHSWIETPTECLTLPLLAKMYKCKYIAGFVADGNKIKSFTQRMAVRYTFAKADAIISNSKAGLLAKGAPLFKSHVIYNGFDDSRLSKTNRYEKRRELGITCKYLVTMAARIDNAKDWDMFINLAEKSAVNNFDVHFLAVGNGDKYEYYQQVVEQRQLKNISFIGRRTDVEEIIDASDICTLFTNNERHAEGVSNFIMEAMAAQKPVIATDGGGTPEIIDNGIDGYIIPAGNVENAFHYVSLLINTIDAVKVIGSNARKKIESKFMLSSMTERYVDLYKQLVKNENTTHRAIT